MASHPEITLLRKPKVIKCPYTILKSLLSQIAQFSLGIYFLIFQLRCCLQWSIE